MSDNPWPRSRQMTREINSVLELSALRSILQWYYGPQGDQAASHMIDTNFDPLFGADPTEIPLPAAPLVTVLGQVRFPDDFSIHQKSFIGGISRSLCAPTIPCCETRC